MDEAENTPNDSDSPEGTKRDKQMKVIRDTAKKESWLTMLLRKRREDKGKPKRRSPVNRPWFRKKD